MAKVVIVEGKIIALKVIEASDGSGDCATQLLIPDDVNGDRAFNALKPNAVIYDASKDSADEWDKEKKEWKSGTNEWKAVDAKWKNLAGGAIHNFAGSEIGDPVATGQTIIEVVKESKDVPNPP